MNLKTKLFLLGFLTLFLELVAIRYLAGSVWNLGYFPNLVLIGVFLGMGLGFSCQSLVPERLSSSIFAGGHGLLLLLLAFVRLADLSVPGFSGESGEFGSELFFTAVPASVEGDRYGPFLALFLGIVLVFAAISQRTAKLFRELPPLTAYSYDIGGSCCGILAFMAVSFFQVSAPLWFLIAAPVAFLALEPSSRKSRFATALALALCAGLAWEQDNKGKEKISEKDIWETVWSPYQKVEFARPYGRPGHIFVNGIGHQQVLPAQILETMFYTAPHQDRARRGLAPYRRVLLIGAGAGNDAAMALRNGAEQVDAIEIDPSIARFGRQFHPERPYEDPRVRLIVDDGRAFLEQTESRYDLIIFALTDSVVKVSPMAQLRLENYLFTEQAVRQAHSLLEEGGDLVLYNSYRRPWLVDKLSILLERGAGHPCREIYRKEEFSVLSVGKEPGGGALPAASGEATDIPTDDWPFLYLKRREIPSFYLLVIAGFLPLIALSLFFVHRKTKTQASPARLAAKIAFLLMGLAFLLLETKSVIQFSLLFGTTWWNNSLVFLGILALVLAANALAPRIGGMAGPWILTGLLLASCLLPLLVPLSNLLQIESGLWRFAAASLLTFSPIFFANLLFSAYFRKEQGAVDLFGWNLFGATLGGAAEYSSLAIGYSSLVWIVAVAYALAFFLLNRAKASQPG